jgi:hypothetical protein
MYADNQARSEPLRAQVAELEKSLEDLKKSRLPLEHKKSKAMKGCKEARNALRDENVSGEVVVSLT